MYQKQIMEAFKIFIYKIPAIICFYLLYVAFYNLQQHLISDMWQSIVVELIFNIVLGMILGLFLINDIKLTLSLKQSIISILILLLLSFYKIYYYYLPPALLPLPNTLFNTSRYFQITLGIYSFFYLKTHILNVYFKNK